MRRGYDEDLFAPEPGRRQRSAAIPPQFWLVIALLLASMVGAVIAIGQISTATNALQKANLELRGAQPLSGFTTGAVTTPADAFQQVQQALTSAETTPTNNP